MQGARLVLALPDEDDLTPAGPLSRGPRTPQVAEEVAGACASADMLLTLAELDPALGADHLSGWAARAVVVVTAGRASAGRIQAVGEMLRLAEVPLISAVLVGGDKTDESLGVTRAPRGGDHAEVTEQDLHSGVDGLLVSAEGSPRDRLSDDR